jgi:ribosomal protein S18 acetylase RimI-like enzyme
MPLIYFKRFRMELELVGRPLEVGPLPEGYALVAWSDSLLREHAEAKYRGFRCELDANVFPCLGRRDGCLNLMREISRRASFVAEATWLLRWHPPGSAAGRGEPVGTVQGLQSDGWGALQNLAIAEEHRGRGLGTQLLIASAAGFRSAGLPRMHLEVTTDNTAAVRLYERFGFRRARTVFKAAEVIG